MREQGVSGSSGNKGHSGNSGNNGNRGNSGNSGNGGTFLDLMDRSCHPPVLNRGLFLYPIYVRVDELVLACQPSSSSTDQGTDD